MPDTSAIAALPGFREFYPQERSERDHLFRLWSQAARRYGFSAYDVPTLEPTALYLSSTEELSEQLFRFVDKGERDVTLRPELTRSLARMVGARANALKRPIRWYNIAENFRYEKPQKGRLRSHYQFNADVFGVPGTGADVEVISLALEALSAFGLGPDDCVLRLSDRDLWLHVLSALGQEGDAALKVLSIVDRMERVDPEVTLAQFRPIFHEASEDVLARLDMLTSLRALPELKQCLLALAPNADLKARLEARLEDFARLVGDLEAMGWGPYVQLDLGIVRGLAYYTGFVFEVFERSAAGTTGRALCGGGRYDHLVGRLGYPELPAVGFGMGDVTLLDLLKSKGLLPAYVDAPDLFLVFGGPEERRAALAQARLLRQAHYRVDYALAEAGFGKQFKAAGASGARFALIYGSDEVARGQVKLRDLQTGEETDLPQVGVLEGLQQRFA